MRTLIQNRDLKTLFGGAAVAVAAGLAMGSALYPDLNEGALPGPQIETGGGGPRAAPAVSDVGLSAYKGRVPDYVVGTDALKPPVYQVLAYDDRVEAQAADTGDDADVMAYAAPAQAHPARWQDEPREATRYPSEQGNVVHESDLPAAPPAPDAVDQDPIAG